jgi:hypothetical protein
MALRIWIVDVRRINWHGASIEETHSFASLPRASSRPRQPQIVAGVENRSGAGFGFERKADCLCLWNSELLTPAYE